MTDVSLQEEYAPKSICFGCGPANPQGLHVRTFWNGEFFVARWQPAPHHQAFPGVLNGGIVGALLDCHSNWGASVYLMKQDTLAAPPCTVTAEFSVKLMRPCPVNAALDLKAGVLERSGNKVTVDAALSSGGKTMATCRGVFVAVNESHPAFHRW